MTTATLVLPDLLASELRAVAALEVETAAVLLVSPTGTAGPDLRLLGRELHWMPEAAYVERKSDSLTVTSDGFVPPLARAEAIGAAAIWVHTHPGAASPQPSDRDRVVDGALDELFRLRTGVDYYGSLVVSGAGGLSFTGHVSADAEAIPITRLWQVGPRLSLALADGVDRPPLPSLFDRNIRALGKDVQMVLGDLRIGVVGCGGTGSAVAEQLIRLGVRDLMVVDPELLSLSNTTRVYGSTPGAVGQPKVQVLAEYLQLIAPDAKITPIQAMVTAEPAARAISGCDVIFGCTDDNAGRLVLSRMAFYFLVPVIDCGVVLSSGPDGLLLGIDGRVTVLSPGSACLVCKDRIDLPRAAAEGLEPNERRRLADEGYAPALPGVEPSVVPFTTLVASVAVAELLERLVGYGPDPEPSEILVRFHEREFSVNVTPPRSGHYCDSSAGKLGVGDTTPFLDTTWSA